MTRQELLARYWSAYQGASMTNYGCDVGELEDLSDEERDSISDSLETVVSVDLLDRIQKWAESDDVYHISMLDGVREILAKSRLNQLEKEDA